MIDFYEIEGLYKEALDNKFKEEAEVIIAAITACLKEAATSCKYYCTYRFEEEVSNELIDYIWEKLKEQPSNNMQLKLNYIQITNPSKRTSARLVFDWSRKPSEGQ